MQEASTAELLTLCPPGCHVSKQTRWASTEVSALSGSGTSSHQRLMQQVNILMHLVVPLKTIIIHVMQDNQSLIFIMQRESYFQGISHLFIWCHFNRLLQLSQTSHVGRIPKNRYVEGELFLYYAALLALVMQLKPVV